MGDVSMSGPVGVTVDWWNMSIPSDGKASPDKPFDVASKGVIVTNQNVPESFSQRRSVSLSQGARTQSRWGQPLGGP